jgi:uncharacterized protein
VDANPDLLRSRNGAGASPTLFATYYGRKDLVAELVRRGGALDLADAVASGNAARVREIVDARPDEVNARSGDGYPMLGLAVFFGHSVIAEYLLDAGADVNASSANDQRVAPIHAAVARKDAAMVSRLLDRGADPNAVQTGGFTPLHGAAAEGSAEIVTLLLGAGAARDRLTEQGKSAAALASERGHRELSALLG